jgi:hypothetical protein
MNYASRHNSSDNIMNDKNKECGSVSPGGLLVCDRHIGHCGRCSCGGTGGKSTKGTWLPAESKGIGQPHKSIAIGKGVIASKPYQFAIDGGKGTVLTATLTPEEYQCLSAVMERLVPRPAASRCVKLRARRKCLRCGKQSPAASYCQSCSQFRKEHRILGGW